MSRFQVRPRVTATLLNTVLATVVIAPLIQCVAGDQRPRVFITDSQSWEVAGSAAGSGGTFAASSRGGARPQTAEIIKTFGERCPQVLVNNKQEKADYVVVLDHEGGKGLLQHRNKIAVFNKEGDAIVSRSTRSLGNSVQDGCAAIVADWSAHAATAAPAPQANAAPQAPAVESAAPTSNLSPVPAKAVPEIRPAQTSATVHPVVATQALPSGVGDTGARAVPVGASPAVSSPVVECEGTASVTSNPDGAEIFVDSVGRGHAPSLLKLSPGKHRIQLAANGYKDWVSEVEVKSGSIVNVTANLEK